MALRVYLLQSVAPLPQREGRQLTPREMRMNLQPLRLAKLDVSEVLEEEELPTKLAA